MQTLSNKELSYIVGGDSGLKNTDPEYILGRLHLDRNNFKDLSGAADDVTFGG